MNNDQTNSHNGPEYWLSLEQFAGSPEFAKRAENEFLSSPQATDDLGDGVARRDFLKLMGASMAMAATACTRPAQTIIPYARAPKEVTPGVANFYTSTWFDGNEGAGLLVKTLEGRPLKFEGNPNHPMNSGSLVARAHAEVLSNYDPDRLKAPVRDLQNKERTNFETISAKWEDIDKEVIAGLAKGEVAILTSTLPSPSYKAIIGDFLKVHGGRWVQYDALVNEPVREAQRLCYGKAVLPRYRVDKAKMIVSIEADILGNYISSAEFIRGFSKNRKPGSEMNRLVSFEGNMTLTGMNADDRFRIKPSQQVDVVLGLISAVAKAGKIAIPAAVTGLVSKYDNAANTLGLSSEAFNKVAADLVAAQGASLVIAGGMTTQTSEAVELQVAVNILNSMLGSDGQTIDHDGSPALTQAGSTREMAKLINDMNEGRVKTLIIHDLNPAYILAGDSKFIDAVRKVDLVLYTGNRIDDTGRLAHYMVPAGTSVENWGDFELQAGVYSIQQPTISPMFDTRSFGDSLIAWAGKEPKAPARLKSSATFYDYVRETWKSEVVPHAVEAKSRPFDDFWQTMLQMGVIVTNTSRERSGAKRTVAGPGFAKLAKLTERKAASGYELALYPTVQLADGRYGNVSWMQELPDPVTKIVWDNYASVSLALARKENLKQGDLIELKVGEKKMIVPAHIQPGLHDEVIALSVGYGQRGVGKVGNDIGVDAYQLASFNGGESIFSGLAVSMRKVGENYHLVGTHDHHSMEGRQIVVETTNKAWGKNEGAGIRRHKTFSIWPSHQYTKHKWAMSIDLNACTGCSACVIACQSENNVPTVGKKYVMQGREMHWIRIDRYFKGAPEAPEAVFMPLTCQQCESAPCETVCPVLATVHNDEGLNDMVYNRCVGTRYCSNNCPYKVRRFNWFNYSKREAPLHMALNPDVTVRSRGVMEKCTFCVHRIRLATSPNLPTSKLGSLKDGTIKTACQETCPANAITFGDLNDPASEVHKLFENKRSYALLEDLNTQPRVRYMSRVRNADRTEVVESGMQEEGEESTPAEGKEGPKAGKGHGLFKTIQHQGEQV